jgi:hypothetical protein
LVEQGQAINQRILTWIINKVDRTILRAAFVVTRKFVSLPCDAPAGLHDGVRESLPPHRPRSMVQETEDLEHQGPHHRVRSRESPFWATVLSKTFQLALWQKRSQALS